MTPLLIYFVKVNLVIGILFTAYYLLLRKEKFLSLNRIILLSIIALAFLLPLLPAMEGSVESRLQRDLSGMSPFFGMGPSREDRGSAAVIDPPPAGTNLQTSRDTAFSFTFINILEVAYAVITTILILRLIFQLFRVYSMIRRSRREKIEGIVYCHHGLDLPPFSFFRHLMLNRDQYPPAEIGQIIAHEQVHIRQGHSFDLLLVEFLHAICWINPLLIGFKRAVKLNLEYIADEKVISTGVDIRAYQYSILRNLQLPGMPLVNEFASSKIKLRIHMINKERSPLRNLYKYALALPLLAGAYLIVNPLKARSASLTDNQTAKPARQDLKSLPLTDNQTAKPARQDLKSLPLTDNQTAKPARQDLKSFEGYYQADINQDGYIRIRANGDQLILKQLWDDKEVIFKQLSALEFSGMDGSLPLKFTKDANGAIVELVALNKDHWLKVKGYTPMTFINLPPAQLRSFEGYYQMADEEGKMAYLQIEATSDGLLLRQGWDGLEIPFVPTSATEFYNKKASFPLEFTKDNNGAVTELIAFRRDHWKKMTNPSGVVMKRQVMLEVPQLKKLEGEYQMKRDNGENASIVIRYADGGIVLRQVWDNVEIPLVPASPTEFFSKQRSFTVRFTVDNNGIATELLAFERDRWVKTK